MLLSNGSTERGAEAEAAAWPGIAAVPGDLDLTAAADGATRGRTKRVNTKDWRLGRCRKALFQVRARRPIPTRDAWRRDDLDLRPLLPARKRGREGRAGHDRLHVERRSRGRAAALYRDPVRRVEFYGGVHVDDLRRTRRAIASRLRDPRPMTSRPISMTRKACR
jgi:hypothetical protein